MTKDDEMRQMARDASERVFTWVKTADNIPAQVAFDIGVLIGRLNKLENTYHFQSNDD